MKITRVVECLTGVDLTELTGFENIIIFLISKCLGNFLLRLFCKLVFRDVLTF